MVSDARLNLTLVRRPPPISFAAARVASSMVHQANVEAILSWHEARGHPAGQPEAGVSAETRDLVELISVGRPLLTAPAAKRSGPTGPRC